MAKLPALKDRLGYHGGGHLREICCVMRIRAHALVVMVSLRGRIDLLHIVDTDVEQDI